MLRTGVIAGIIFISALSHAQFSFDTILRQHPLLKKISAAADKYHLQILYTEIERKGDKVTFENHFYNIKPENYFYCASLVKLPAAILAVQKLNELNIPLNAVMYTDSMVPCEFKVTRDTSTFNKLPSVEHYIKKMFLVSDNFAFSRIYEFLGVSYIHQTLSKMGYPDIRIMNRYDGTCTGRNSYLTNPVSFLDQNLNILYKQEAQYPKEKYRPVIENLQVGKAYYINKERFNKPKDFTYSNYLNLTDCHSLLTELIFNQNQSFDLTSDQRTFLITQLSLYPRQSQCPKYDPKTFRDSYKKYLYYGDRKETIIDSNLIITNIVGQSYGFLSDCAYFQDKENKIEFILSAALYANEDEVLSDGKYDYETIGLPFLAELGRQIYRYEKEKKNK